jgi:CRP/FNR family transcriptional regulator, cyclic AMP receptor protein
MNSLDILSEEKIKAHPFLDGLDPRSLEALDEAAMEVEFVPQEIIFRQNEPANRFYLILDGAVVLQESDSFPFQIIHGGSVLGWSALFPPYLTQFEARAIKKTRAIFFYGSRIREKFETDHSLGYELMKRMGTVLNERLQARRKVAWWWQLRKGARCPEGNLTTRFPFRT